MARSIKEVVTTVVRVLSPETKLAAGWDSRLPQYASVDLVNGITLIIAQYHEHHILSIATKSQVKSVIITGDESEEVLSNKIQTMGGKPSHFAEETDYVSDLSSNGPRTGTTSSIPVESNSRILRDPNAPPGFEFETFPSRNPVPEPGIEFDPDQDLYPPGGRYPLLGPMAGPMNNGPFRPSGSGGMHPNPLGPTKPPGIRYDPTSPFGGPPFNPRFGGPPF